MTRPRLVCQLAALFVFVLTGAISAQAPARFGIGRPATPQEIARLDIDVMPDGTGLPPGRGTPAEGAAIYASKCAACHGETGREGPNDVLVGREPREGFPFAQNPKLAHTIGNYWPYATTVFDYVRRAMPPMAPGSLTDDEVYALTAFLLNANELVANDAVMDRSTLPAVKMPAREHFVPDTRDQTARKPRR
ncbi:MAG TPA: cytochrome c [Vicinamibacterales bacterium]|nr:cytochrome c [Vicinamibacterales bacterium]